MWLVLLVGEMLGLDFFCSDKWVLVFVEIDGCFVDGVSVGSGCWLGWCMLWFVDYGKVVVVVVDICSG